MLTRRTATTALAALALVAGLTAPASAESPRTENERGVSTGTTVAVPGLNRGEAARFTVIDTGRSMVIIGQGAGMGGARLYLSLIYPDTGCAQPQPVKAALTVDGVWQDIGEGRRTLYATYTGEAYRAVRGHIGSISVREITAAENTGGGEFTFTATARACAALDDLR